MSELGKVSSPSEKQVITNVTEEKNVTTSENKESQQTTAVLVLQDTSDVFKGEDNVPHVILLSKEETLIGRKNADYSIESKQLPRLLSRKHCIIKRTQPSNSDTDSESSRKHIYHIVDQGSLNGTFINGFKVEKQELSNGDFIIFGSGAKTGVGQELPSEAVAKSIRYEFLTIESEQQRREFEARKRMAFKRKYSYLLSEDKVNTENPLESLVKDEDHHNHNKRRRVDSKGSYVDTSKNMQTSPSSCTSVSPGCQSHTQEHHTTTVPASSSTTQPYNEPNEQNEKLTQLQQERDALEKQMAALKEELEKERSSAIRSAELTDEFTCSICQSLILEAVSLRCSHTFCRLCLGQWLKDRDTCPTCRKRCKETQPSSEPSPKKGKGYCQVLAMRSRTMDSVIEKLVKRLPQDVRQEWEERKERTEAEDTDALTRLKASVKQAMDKKMRFLNIRDAWKSADKESFAVHVNNHAGKSRLYYCSLTGLTTNFVSSAPVSQLVRAMDNLQLPLPPRLRGQGLDVEAVRERLNEFLMPLV